MDTSENVTQEQTQHKSHYVLRSFHGLEKLWMAYWLNFVAINTAVSNVVDTLITDKSLSIQIVFLIVILTVLIGSIVSVWRCAFNVKNHYWGYIARVIVVVGPLISFYFIFSS